MGELNEQGVAKEVAHGVINPFEIVNVNDKERRAESGVRRQGLFDAALGNGFVIEAGERIPLGAVQKGLCTALFVVNVDDDPYGLHSSSGAVLLPCDPYAAPAVRAVRPAYSEFGFTVPLSLTDLAHFF